MGYHSGQNGAKPMMAEVFAIAWRMAVFLAVIYALVAVGAHFMSLGMLFPRPPVSYQLTPDYLQLTTPDGVRLAARYWPNPSAKYTLLYLHGNYEDLGKVGEYMSKFLSAGYAAFALDYRHYGQSGGTPTEANTCADAQLAYDYLHQKLGVPADRIIIFGYSLGGGVAVDLALHRPAAGLVLQCPFVSAYRVLTRYRLLPGDKFVNIDKVPKLKLPVLVIHGTADVTIPWWHGEALFQAVTSPKMKLFIEGGPHVGLGDYAGPPYWEELKKFSDSLPAAEQ